MPYSTSLPGIDEACLDAILAAMVAKITDLNNVLSGASPAITLGETIDSTYFNIGDPETLPPSKSFWVSVTGGGKQDGRDTTIAVKQALAGYNITKYHNIYFYLSPQAFPGTDAFAQATLRERFRARFMDWLLWDVFNTGANYELTLSSRLFSTAPAYDTLDECKITDVTKGFVAKSFGGTQWCFMSHALHYGVIYGGTL